MNKAQLPLSLLDQIAGRNAVDDPQHLKKSGIIYLQADKFTIKNIDNAPLHVDGEPRETAKTVYHTRYTQLLQIDSTRIM